MKKYAIESRTTKNRVEVEYDDRGLLASVRFETPCQSDAIEFMTRNIPVFEKQVTAWLPGRFDISLIPEEVKFERFWEAYGYKVGKLNAEKEWSKLTMTERAKAIRMVPRYHAWRQSRVPAPEAVYPERYLKHKRFDDDFKF